MGRRRRLNLRPVSIIACSVGLPSIAILGQWGERLASVLPPALPDDGQRDQPPPPLPPPPPPAPLQLQLQRLLGLSSPAEARPPARRPRRSTTTSSSNSGAAPASAPAVVRPARLRPPSRRGGRGPMRGGGGGGPRCLGLLPARVMSHVRLSNGSPTLERMDARRADSPKPSACRSLFGPLDHDELARELARHRRHLAEASRAKWNFDFERHRPLDGRYEWRAVAADALPDFYSRPPPRLRAGPDPDAGPGAAPRKRPADAPDDSSHQSKRANTTEEISEDSPSASSEEQTPKKPSPRRHHT